MILALGVDVIRVVRVWLQRRHGADGVLAGGEDRQLVLLEVLLDQQGAGLARPGPAQAGRKVRPAARKVVAWVIWVAVLGATTGETDPGDRSGAGAGHSRLSRRAPRAPDALGDFLGVSWVPTLGRSLP